MKLLRQEIIRRESPVLAHNGAGIFPTVWLKFISQITKFFTFSPDAYNFHLNFRSCAMLMPLWFVII